MLKSSKADIPMEEKIPSVDISPFFQEQDDVVGMKKAKGTIDFACRTYGFFRIVNHGMSNSLMRRAINLSNDFFGRKYDEKMKFSSDHGSSKSPLPTGYMRQPEISGNKNEYVMMFNPELGFNVYPTEPLEFRSTFDDCFTELSKIALLIERILTECMGLPPNSIQNYDEDRRTDIMIALRYFSMTNDDHESNGLVEHQDGSCFSLVFQDEVGGLEVLRDEEWISVDPEEGSIIVNIGDLVQVMTNNTYISAMHRVLRRDKDRYSCAFFFNADGERWIEPLPQFTSEIGVSSKYKGFLYKDYLQLRMKNISLPRKDFFDISKFSISHCNQAQE